MDQVYPVIPGKGSEVLAQVNEEVVGTSRNYGNGKCTYLGFRPRDDQSESLGYEERTWFEILDALGAYPATGTFAAFNDNTEHLSRTTDYLCTRFPNQTTVIARHYRTHPESWEGGFGRNRDQDIIDLDQNPLPSGRVDLELFKVNGHEVTFHGDLLVAFRLDDEGDLLAYHGRDCKEITIDGKTTSFADQNVDQIAWAPVVDKRQIPGKAFFQIYLEGKGEVHIPLKTDRRKIKMFDESQIQGSAGNELSFNYKKGIITVKLNNNNTGRWLYLTGE